MLSWIISLLLEQMVKTKNILIAFYTKLWLLTCEKGPSPGEYKVFPLGFCGIHIFIQGQYIWKRPYVFLILSGTTIFKLILWMNVYQIRSHQEGYVCVHPHVLFLYLWCECCEWSLSLCLTQAMCFLQRDFKWVVIYLCLKCDCSVPHIKSFWLFERSKYE